MHRTVFAVLLALTLAAGEPIPVVTGNTVVDDLARRIGGERFVVTCLMPAGVDPHTYEPVPDDIRKLAGARLVIINGLGFEGWFEKLAKEASFTGTVVVATRGLKPLKMEDDHGHHGHGHGHGHGHRHASVDDPHAYLSVRHGVRYAENIRDALSAADTAGAAGIQERAAALIAELRAADAWATETLAAIPRARRKIVTNHDALAYFAKDYGFQVLAPNTALEDSQPGAKEIAAIVGFIRKQGVTGVFLESGKNPKLIEQIAAEAKVKVGGHLYLDGLGPAGSPAATYLGMFKANVQVIADALR